MLIVPQQWDQPLNAVRVAYHGVGSWMHASQTSAQAITESVRTLAADASVRSRIRELQLVFLASHGDQVTARVCSTLLQESCGTAREQIVR
jgi:UDP:flavonoid glycosyltransferase YjiC (YdhE family)